MHSMFSFSRWWMLVILHWAENRRRYGLGVLAMGGLLLFWFSVILAMDAHAPLSIGYQFGTFYIGLFFTGCLFGSQVFSALNRKREAIQYLMVPASHLEKLLCGLLYGVVLFFIVYTLLFYLVDIPMVQLAGRIAKKGPPMFTQGDILIQRPVVYSLFGGGAWNLSVDAGNYLLMVYFAVQAFFILGSIYFTRYPILKTIIAGLLLSLLGSIFMGKVIEANLPTGWHMENLFDWYRDDKSAGEQWVRLPGATKEFLLRIIKYSLPFIFWFITYFRLKEKEV
jgi:hypothetical protein